MPFAPAADGAWSRQRTTWLVLGLAFAFMPLMAAEYLPLSDLPQHLAQIRLLEELLGLAPRTLDVDSLTVRLFGANTLVYLPLFLISRVVPIMLAGKLTVGLILGSSVGALHWLAARRSRPALHALLAGCFLFNVALYWGFLNFLSGLPLFLWFVAWALSPAASRSRLCAWLGSSLFVFGLFLAHVFWLPCAALVVLVSLCSRQTRGSFVWHAAGFVPSGVIALMWLPWLRAFRTGTGASMAMEYVSPISARFNVEWAVASAMGGITGPGETIVAGVLLAYGVFALVNARQRRQPDVDLSLLLIALVLLLFTLLAPDVYFNTIMLNARFLSLTCMLLLLAIPGTLWRPACGVAAVAAAAFSVVVTCSWAMFDQDDLTGLRESLASVRGPRKLLGLDFRRQSSQFTHFPYLQIHAYFQARTGGQLNFSFAEHASSIVSYRKPPHAPWQSGLEWFPGRATRRDVELFDCVLVNATPSQHDVFSRYFHLSSPVREGFFRIYCHDQVRS